jgi:hypothetical protein
MARTIGGLLAAALFAFAGFQMTSLQSQSGNTVAELFDNAMGWFSWGMAAISAAWALSAPVAEKDDLRNGYKRCVECAEPVREAATKCPHCATDLIEAEDDEDAFRQGRGPGTQRTATS